MGNEMGNNNTSGLREKENTGPANQKKSLREPPYSSDLKNVVPTTELKVYHQKDTVLNSDDLKGAGDGPLHDQKPDGKEQLPQVHSEEYPEAGKETNKGGAEDGVVQSADSLAEELEGHEKLSSSNSDEKVSNSQIEDVSKTGKQDHEKDPKLQDSAELKSDQHELTKNHADESEQNGIISQKGSEDDPGSSIACHDKANVPDDTEGAEVSGADSDVGEKGENLSGKEMPSAEDEMSRKEKSDVEAGIEDGSSPTKPTAMLSDISEVNSGEIADKINGNGNSLDSKSPLQEGCLPESKAQETNLVGEELGSADGKHDDKELARLPEIDNTNASQTDSSVIQDGNNIEKGDSVTTVHPADGDGNCQVEEVKVSEESDNHNEVSEECCKGSEEKAPMNHEPGTLTAESAVASGKANGAELGDTKPEASMAHEVDNGNCQGAEAKAINKSENQNEASEGHQEGSEGKIKMVPELGNTDEQSIANRENLKEETTFSKPDADNIHDADSSGDGKIEEAKCVEEFDNHTEQGTLPAEHHATSGKESEEKPEDLKKEETTDINPSASANNSSEQHQINETSNFAEHGIHEKENKGNLSADPIPENLIQAQESKSQNITTESTGSAVELGNEKPQEVAQSNSAKGSHERQPSAGRIRNGSFSDDLNVHAEIRKSPSFDLNLSNTEESDETPLICQDKNAIESSSGKADANLEKSFPQAQHSQELPVEKKVITLERSDSDKLKEPFLGYLKEEEEAVMPMKQDQQARAEKTVDEEKSPMSIQTRARHRRRSNLFTNCLSCARLYSNKPPI